MSVELYGYIEFDVKNYGIEKYDNDAMDDSYEILSFERPDESGWEVIHVLRELSEKYLDKYYDEWIIHASRYEEVFEKLYPLIPKQPKIMIILLSMYRWKYDESAILVFKFSH